MSNPVIDVLIFVLLVISVGFGGIGVIGLVLFPDIRSRMHTAFRASLISIGVMTLALILYALFAIQSEGSEQYAALLLRTIVILCIVIVANIVLYRTIRARTKRMVHAVPEENGIITKGR